MDYEDYETYDPNINLNKPYIYNFEKGLWIKFETKCLDIKMLNKEDYIGEKYKLYNKGVFIENEFDNEADKELHKAFVNNKGLNISFEDFKKRSSGILKDFYYISWSQRYKYIKNNKIYVKNCSFSKTPYKLEHLKNHQYIKSNNVEVVEVGEKETPEV
jgi:hypothetical protein